MWGVSQPENRVGSWEATQQDREKNARKEGRKGGRGEDEGRKEGRRKRLNLSEPHLTTDLLRTTLRALKGLSCRV
jgi:hypothetical protein